MNDALRKALNTPPQPKPTPAPKKEKDGLEPSPV
jgi:hypothetical protein